MRRIEFIMSDLFKYSPQTYFNHKKEKRPILELLEKYFTKDDIEEFLDTGKIEKFEIAQNNDYLLKKSIKLYNSINSSLGFLVRKILFLALTQLNSYKIEDISNIIFYSIKDEDLNLSALQTENISSMSVRLNLFNLFQKIDSFELEYFIKNSKKIRKESFLFSCKEKNYIYNIENIDYFGEKFFKIEKGNSFIIKNLEKYNNKISLFLDILDSKYNKRIIQSSEILETNKKLDLIDDELDIFLDLIEF